MEPAKTLTEFPHPTRPSASYSTSAMGRTKTRALAEEVGAGNKSSSDASTLCIEVESSVTVTVSTCRYEDGLVEVAKRTGIGHLLNKVGRETVSPPAC